MIIEKEIRDYLLDKISADVYLEQPKEKPSSYVLIEKTGGKISEFLRSGTIAIQSYAPSLYEASKLNEDVIKAMTEIIAINNITSCTLNSDYNYTNQTTKQYRYQAIFNLIYY